MLGLIDTTGEFVIAPQFDFLFPKNNNLISIVIGEKKGLIDTQGNVILKPQFKDIYYNEQEKIIWVRNDADKWGLLDVKGNFIIPPRFDNVYYTGEEPTRVILNNRFYLVNKFGDVITIPPFDNVNPFKDGISEADKFSEKFRINSRGQIILDETLEHKD